MDPDLEQRVQTVESLQKQHLVLLMRMLQADGGATYGLDLIATAAVKRSMALCSGYATLVRAQNYVCSVTFIRMQLDSCLRMYAAFIVDKPHELAIRVITDGVPIRKMRDREGNLMTDRYLVEKLTAADKDHEWVTRVYEATSGFIHLSDRHVFTVFDPGKIDSKKRTLSLVAGATDEHIPIELWIEQADGFLAATDLLFKYLVGWVRTKEDPPSRAPAPTVP